MRTLALLAFALALPALDIAIDAERPQQRIDGIGTCTMHWTMAKTGMANPRLQQLWGPEGLDCSIARFAVPTELLPETEDAAAITVDAIAAKAAQEPVFHWLKAVAARPGVTVLASAWSPPGWMKSNGRTNGGGSLRPDRVAHLARYDAAVVQVLRRDFGVTVQWFSPQNELSFVEPYASCVYKPEEYANLVAELGRTFRAAGLTTRVAGPEDMTKFPDRLLGFVNAVQRQAEAKSVFGLVASHGYSDGIAAANGKDDYAGLFRAVQPLGLPLWMSETSLAGYGWDPIDVTRKTKQGKKTASSPGALSLARCMHNAFVHGGNSAFIFWCLSGDAQKDKSGQAEIQSLLDGETLTKKFHVFSQFSRYVRPGMRRLPAEPSASEGLLASAYRAEDGTTAVVLINDDDAERTVTLRFGARAPAGPLQAWRTSAEDDRREQPAVPVKGGAAAVILPPSCIITLVGR